MCSFTLLQELLPFIPLRAEVRHNAAAMNQKVTDPNQELPQFVYNLAKLSHV